MACELLGLTPRDVDTMSFRDLWLMIAAAQRREQRKWAHTLAICQAVWNWGGPRSKDHRPRSLSSMYEESFGSRRKTMTAEEIGNTFAAFAEKPPKPSRKDG